MSPVQVEAERFLGTDLLSKQTMFGIRRTAGAEDNELTFCNWEVTVAGTPTPSYNFVDDDHQIALNGSSGTTLASIRHRRGASIEDGESDFVMPPDLDGYSIDVYGSDNKMFSTLVSQQCVSKHDGREYCRWHAYQKGSATTMFDVESGLSKDFLREIFLTKGFCSKGPLLASCMMHPFSSWQDVKVSMPAGAHPPTLLILLVATFCVEDGHHLLPGPKKREPNEVALQKPVLRRHGSAAGSRSSLRSSVSHGGAEHARSRRSHGVRGRASMRKAQSLECVDDSEYSLAALRAEGSGGRRRSSVQSGALGEVKGDLT
eukprot:CAMPEP_0115521190 /NCGR_PEP_ID=MMETSP0271-20121206/79408_1 /TAXON_ID=71861 /ORGANISM="Scrippsiella trochoidea, Strain CCMP3099" /LENGTH=316 /DNA_ID=CAMNT_0002952393 /DNA_START=85 /DNA_END=1032 /DNA_ORIENTATION=+